MWSARLALILCSLAIGACNTDALLASDTDSDASAGNETETSEAETQSTETEQVAFCPEGWVIYKDKCLFFSEDTTDHSWYTESCGAMGALPTEILTKDKYDFIAGISSEEDKDFLLALKKGRGYVQSFVWTVSNKPANQYYQPDGLGLYDEDYAETCITIQPNVEGVEGAHCSTVSHYICEKDIQCIPGRFGPGCQSECHCAGEPCNTRPGDVTCKWGCQLGWTGPSCSAVKEQPDVRYFCINSPEEHIGSYVDIHIHTKGINYRSIYAQMANSTEQGPWCPGTAFSPEDTTFERTTITLRMNDSIADEIRDGKCVGQELAKNQFQWTLVIQEYADVLLDTDLQVVISCNFNSSETLQRASQSGPSGAESFSEKVELTPETTDVALEVMDPFQSGIISAAPVGTPVKLQVKFGFQEGSLVKGVRPHHCMASTPDGSMVKNLLDQDGCTVPGSPVQSFAKDVNSTTSISTVWFPLFAFPNYHEVEFKCSFQLCFNPDSCNPGCRRSHKGRRRYTRSSKLWPELERDGELDWRSKIIHILDDVPLHDRKVVDALPVYAEQQDNLVVEENSDQQPPKENPKTPQTLPANTEEPAESLDGIHIPSLLIPVACGVLLLLLLILTILFLTLHFSLRKTVEDMHEELRANRRSRDRTLHCPPSLGRSSDKPAV